MTRLCVIGNSHLAAVRNFMRTSTSEHLGIEAELFAQSTTLLNTAELNSSGELAIDGAIFRHFKPGSEDRHCVAVPWQDFDAVVIVGLHFGAGCVVKLYRNYHFFGLKGRRPQTLTRENFRKAARQSIDESAAMRLVRLNAQSGKRPVFLAPTPLPSRNGFTEAATPLMFVWRLAAEAGDIETLLGIYDDICAEMAAEGINVVGQPEETKANRWSTLPEFKDYSEKRPENDYVHMNEVFGGLLWRDVLTMVQTKIPAP